MIDYRLYRLSRRMKRAGRFAGFVFQGFHILPFIAAIAFFQLLSGSGQLREIYFSIVEVPLGAGVFAHWLAAVVFLLLLSAALFVSNWLLTTLRINRIYAEIGTPAVDGMMRVTRIFISLLVAAAPWLGVIVGLAAAAGVAQRHGADLDGARAIFGTSAEPAASGFADFALISHRLWTIFYAILSLAICVLIAMYAGRRSPLFRKGVQAALLVALLAFMLAPVLTDGGGVFANAALDGGRIVSIYRAIGPLGAVLLAGLGFYAIAVLIVMLPGQISGLIIALGAIFIGVALVLDPPLYWISGAASLTFVLLFVLGFLSRNVPLLVASIPLVLGCVTAFIQSPLFAPQLARSQAAAPQGLTIQFASWRKERERDIAAYRRAYGADYPVFLVAAQGGGSYAATAASAFLARLQDLCPAFAQHVFAISGVSGGAVGASFFQSAVADRELTSSGCAPLAADARSAPAKVERQVGELMRDDHLSPLLGYVAADLTGFRTDRAVGLEQSLIYSGRRPGHGDRLSQAFIAHWSPAKAAPALVLNATWADTGNTVAFAPFTFSNGRERPLLSFADREIRDPAKVDGVSLAQAAVVSARFPGVLPAYTLPAPGDPTRRRNFVDGGYTDNSGSETALAMLGMIKDQPSAKGLDFRLLLLTSAAPRPDWQAVKGVFLRDTLAPMQALLNVRARLAEKAIARTLGALHDLDEEGRPKHEARKGSRDGWKSAVIEVDQESFTLALGWQISAATHSLISSMMGEPTLCQKFHPVQELAIEQSQDDEAVSIAEGEAGLQDALKGDAGEEDALKGLKIASRMRNNSCIMKAVLALVDPRLDDPRTAQPGIQPPPAPPGKVED